MSNKIIIAGAGSGKTTFLVKEAVKITNERVLITTFTIANQDEIKKKFFEIVGYLPTNVTVQTWFSFLLQHGVKPYQSYRFTEKIKGLVMLNGSPNSTKGKVNNIYQIKEINPKHFFTSENKIYTDKLPKLVCRINEDSNGKIVERLVRVFPNIFIDEIQDLAGYDLEIVKLLVKSSCNLLMVGDPRQTTYQTHSESKYKRYRDGKIVEFLSTECKKFNVVVDSETLNKSYRNHRDICRFANKIYPEFEPCLSVSRAETGHDGVFLVLKSDVGNYLEKYNPTQLRYSKMIKVNDSYKVMSFGNSKGLTMERVLVYPTKKIEQWVYTEKELDSDITKAKTYVAITRAKYSVAFIVEKLVQLDGVQHYHPDDD